MLQRLVTLGTSPTVLLLLFGFRPVPRRGCTWQACQPPLRGDLTPSPGHAGARGQAGKTTTKPESTDPGEVLWLKPVAQACEKLVVRSLVDEVRVEEHAGAERSHPGFPSRSKAMLFRDLLLPEESPFLVSLHSEFSPAFFLDIHEQTTRSVRRYEGRCEESGCS